MTPRTRNRLTILVLFALCLIAVGLRVNAGLARDLWEDEIIAAAHAEQPFWRLPAEVVRDDVHPPLYFLQLHAWAMLGGGDLWLRLNSLLWNFAALGLLFAAIRRLYGTRCGIMAAAAFAVAAPVVWMAQELRPYSFLYCLLIGAFFCLERMFGAADRRLATRAGAFGCILAIAYSHAIGFFAVFLLGMYALGRVFETGATRRAILDWTILFASCAVLAMPPIIIAMGRDANLGAGGGVASDLAGWLSQLLLPRPGNGIWAVAAGALYVGIAATAACLRETRLLSVTLLILPLALAAALDAGHVSLFKLNMFSTITIPFVTIAAARILAALKPARGFAAATALCAVFAAFSVVYRVNRAPTTGFREASALIVAEKQPGDVVFVPQQSMFWGMARYLGETNSGWQLQVAPPVSAPWRRIYDRIGPSLVQLFGLEPETQCLQTRSGVPMLIGGASAAAASSYRRVWLVTYERADLPAVTLGNLHLAERRVVGFLQVRLYN